MLYILVNFIPEFFSGLQNQRTASLKAVNTNNYDPEFEPLAKLLQAILSDPVINKKVISILKMDSYPRRLILNNWLEQLRSNNAPNKLTQTLSYLFDDIVAEKVLTLINNRLN